MNYPLVKFSIYFIIGILISNLIGYSNILLISTGIGLLISITTCYLFSNNKLAFPFFIVLAGGFIHSSYEQIHKTKEFDKNLIILEANSIPERKGMNISLVAKEITTNQLVMVYLKDSTILESKIAGSFIITEKYPKINEKTIEKYGFDYTSFLAKKGVHHTLFLKRNEFKISTNKTWIYKLTLIKESFDRQLKTYFPIQKEYHFLKGILLGSNKEMEAQTIQNFRDSGAVHILSVSGLHIMAFAFIIEFILRPLLKNRYSKWIYLLGVLSFVWFYAFITMLSAAAIRSAIMYSMFTISKIANRKNIMMNSMAISMIIILTFNPNELFQLGFQLSFAAVFGILILSDFWENLISTRIKALKKISQGITAGLSAQTTTFPLILFYFGKFPIYFLPANIILIALSNLIILGGMVFIPLSYQPFKWINLMLAKGISILIQLSFLVAELFSRLPNSVINFYNNDLIEILVLTLSIGLLIYCTLNKDKLTFKVGLISFCCLFLTSIFSFLSFSKEREIINLKASKSKLVIYPKNGIYIPNGTKLNDFQLQSIGLMARGNYIPEYHIYYANFKKLEK